MTGQRLSTIPLPRDSCANTGHLRWCYSSAINPNQRFKMKRCIVCGAIASLLVAGVSAADSNAKEEISKAATKLADSSYSWHTTVKVPEDSPFKPGPTEGKTEKDGFTVVKVTFNENTSEIVLKGDKAAVKREGEWQSASDLENAQGPGRFMGAMIRNFKAPAEQVKDLLSSSKEIKKEGDAYSTDLTEDGAKKLLSLRRRQGGDAPNV